MMRIELILENFSSKGFLDDSDNTLLKILSRRSRDKMSALKYITHDEQAIFSNKQTDIVLSELVMLDKWLHIGEADFFGNLVDFCFEGYRKRLHIRFVPESSGMAANTTAVRLVTYTAVVAESGLDKRPTVVVTQLEDDLHVRGVSLWADGTDIEAYSLLSQIDPYRDTYLNRYQMVDFIDEWDRFFANNTDSEVQGQVAKVREFAVMVRDGHQLFLKFNGE